MPRAMMDFQITVNVCKCASEGVPVAADPARGIIHTFQREFYRKLFSLFSIFCILYLLACFFFMLKGILRLSGKRFHWNRFRLDVEFQHGFWALTEGVLVISVKWHSLYIIGGSCSSLKRARPLQVKGFFQFWRINIVVKTKRYFDRSAQAVSII